MSEEMKNELEEAVEETVEEAPVDESPVEEIDEKAMLVAQVDALSEQVAKLKNDYARAYADAENTKKRLQKDFDQMNKYRIQSFAREILPVLDNCERALAVKPEDSQDENYRKAFEMVWKQLRNALEKEGVTEIDALNQPFDANLHQAMMTEVVEGVEPGTVTEVLQKGYMLKDRLLRAAMVKVSE